MSERDTSNGNDWRDEAIARLQAENAKLRKAMQDAIDSPESHFNSRNLQAALLEAK